MTKVNYIKLNNFRNFIGVETFFDKNLNIFYGENGSGKTNILEAISLTAKGRGIRNSNLSQLIKINQKNFFIKTALEIEKNIYDVEIFTKENNGKLKKYVSVNNDLTKETIKFLNSSLSFLTFLPEMERLFQSSPSYRRNFIDRLIFSEKNDYNTLINKYKKNLIERSRILQLNNFDNTWLSSIESQICNYGLEIYKLRNIQINLLNEYIEILNKSNKYDLKIKLDMKDVFFDKNLNYEKYLSQLSNLRDFDKKFGGSKIGPHKSDIVANVNDNFDASQLSTGQQKTVVLMILLAQCHYLVNFKKISPILLLDEICSHLDLNNRKILLDIIKQFEIQLFLTGTSKTLFSFISTNTNFYNITEL